MGWALVFSLVVHLALLIGFKFTGFSRPDELENQPIDIEYRPQSEPLKKRPHISKGQMAPSGRVTLKNLLPGPGVSISESDSVRIGSGSPGDGGNDVFTFTGEYNLEEFSPNMPYFAAIWNRFNSVLEYPEDFFKQDIQGDVVVHFKVDHRGVFKGHFLKVLSGNSYLETYVLALLLHSLKDPLPEKLWLKGRSEIPVGFSVRFATYHDPTVDLKPGNYLKNYFTFNRYAFLDPKLNRQIEALFTKYVPPIVPIPGGFFIDFVRAYKMVRSIGTTSDEQKRAERLRNMKRSLELTIQKLSELENPPKRESTPQSST